MKKRSPGRINMSPSRLHELFLRAFLATGIIFTVAAIFVIAARTPPRIDGNSLRLQEWRNEGGEQIVKERAIFFSKLGPDGWKQWRERHTDPMSQD
jgi:hypothetical protein